MSYSKLPLVCEDFGLGLQNVNTAKGNLEEFMTDWSAEHAARAAVVAAGSPVNTQDRYDIFGRHNTPHVPRAVIDVSVATAIGGVLSISVVEAVNTVLAVDRLSTGVWFVTMAAPLSLFFGDPQPAQPDATAARWCIARGNTGNGGIAGSSSNGLIITTYELSSGDFALKDYSFTCGVYSYG
jgi:hypothetical protein